MDDWLILTATLPAKPSALRVRVWRALKATGAAALREGVYVLPAAAPTAATLWEIERTIVAAGADAYLLTVTARDRSQQQSFRALFDRSEQYAELLHSIRDSRKALTKAGEPELRKTVRALEQQLQKTRNADFFGSALAEQAGAALVALRREIELRLSPGEPIRSSATIERQHIGDYQGRTWATRQRPWVDRLATAWLVQRFIDKKPSFIWLVNPKKFPKSALGYDFDGARFTHVGDKVTFEVVAATFGLDDLDAALRRVGALVHAIDVGGSLLDEAPGLELIVRGLQAQHLGDDDLLAAALPVFDAVYAAMKAAMKAPA